jgi:RNA polymerase sigma factor (sigma-70 family)
MHFENQGVSLGGLLKVAQADAADDSLAMNDLVRRFRFLAKKLARGTGAPSHMLDDIEGAALLALVAAVRNHDSARPGFPAYARIYMKGAVLREYQRLLSPEGITVTPTPLEMATELPRREDEAVLDRLEPLGGDALAGLIAQMPPRQRRLLGRRYVEDEPLAMIAAEDGTSASAVSQRLGTAYKHVVEGLAA